MDALYLASETMQKSQIKVSCKPGSSESLHNNLNFLIRIRIYEPFKNILANNIWHKMT